MNIDNMTEEKNDNLIQGNSAFKNANEEKKENKEKGLFTALQGVASTSPIKETAKSKYYESNDINDNKNEKENENNEDSRNDSNPPTKLDDDSQQGQSNVKNLNNFNDFSENGNNNDNENNNKDIIEQN